MSSKIKYVLVLVGTAVVSFFSAVVWVFFYSKDKNIQVNAEEAKVKKYEEIKSADADGLVKSAVNTDELESINAKIKHGFRERVRDRFREKLQRTGSDGADPNTD